MSCGRRSRPVSSPGPRPAGQQRRGERQRAGRRVPFSRQAVSKHWRAGGSRAGQAAQAGPGSSLRGRGRPPRPGHPGDGRARRPVGPPTEHDQTTGRNGARGKQGTRLADRWIPAEAENALPGLVWRNRLGGSPHGAAQLSGKEAQCPLTFRRLRRLTDSVPGRASAQQRNDMTSESASLRFFTSQSIAAGRADDVPPSWDERTVLTTFLDYARDTVHAKCADLSTRTPARRRCRAHR